MTDDPHQGVIDADDASSTSPMNNFCTAAALEADDVPMLSTKLSNDPDDGAALAEVTAKYHSSGQFLFLPVALVNQVFILPVSFWKCSSV